MTGQKRNLLSHHKFVESSCGITETVGNEDGHWTTTVRVVSFDWQINYSIEGSDTGTSDTTGGCKELIAGQSSEL